jgi:hypothetical protein
MDKKAKLDAVTASSELLPQSEDLDQQEQTEAMRETAYGCMVSERQPLLFEGGALRPYQLDGLDWLKVSFIYAFRSHLLLQSFSLKMWVLLTNKSDCSQQNTQIKVNYASLIGQ